MFARYSSYVLLFNFIYHYYDFFLWYLGDQQIQIEHAYYKGIYAFTSALVFIVYIHVLFFPKNNLNAPNIPSFPPLIMLFSLNFGLLIGVYNLYFIQLLMICVDQIQTSKIGYLDCFESSGDFESLWIILLVP